MAMFGSVVLASPVGVMMSASVMRADAHDRGFRGGPSDATAENAEDHCEKQLLHTLVLLQTSLFITIPRSKFQ